MAIIKVVNSEKSQRLLEFENKVTLIVDRFTDKDSLIDEIKAVYGVKVVDVHLLWTPKGEKKAIVKLDKSHAPDEIATKFGLVV